MCCHLSALVGHIIPFGNIIGPLVIWLIKKDELPGVNDHGKEALNFQISMTIYFIIAVVLVFVVIGIPLLIVLWLADLILIIIAAIHANDGKSYRYPMTMRFVK